MGDKGIIDYLKKIDTKFREQMNDIKTLFKMLTQK